MVQSQRSVKHSHSGITASCSVQCRRRVLQARLRIVQSDLQNNMDDVLIKNNLQVM